MAEPQNHPALEQCEDELIRVPGSVQPHGWMVIASASGELLAFSENWPSEADALAAIQLLSDSFEALVAGDAPAPLGEQTLLGKRLDASAHRCGDRVILEFEAASPDGGVKAPIYSLARHLLPQLQKSQDIRAISEITAHEMKRLTGFGRCLVYRFDELGHGQVLAQEIEPGYDSYAGHHFPASDIPAQARDLYRLNHIRLIPSAIYEPVGLLCKEPGLSAKMIDLSLASLRSVSPIHLEYMRNMGTLASMSVSIVVNDALWGLVSCHDHDPRFLTLQTRVACEHLGRLVSMQIKAVEENAEVAARLQLRQIILQLVSGLSDSDATLQQLIQNPRELLRMGRASGAAVVLNDLCWKVGDTPEDDSILLLSKWIAEQNQPVFHSDRLSEIFEPARTMPELCSGVLAASISQFNRHQIIWFRPEVVRTIEWAGEPRKDLRQSDGRIHPRKSFSSWKEEVSGRSVPWLSSEVAAADELRQALISVVLRRVEELAEVASELGRVNKELEAFSYTVSHDLRAPMRQISGYVDLVLQAEGLALSEKARRYLGNVKDASSFAGQLVDALLDFSRMGRSALKRRSVDIQSLVESLCAELMRDCPGRSVEWSIDPSLPTLWADPLLIQVAIRNMMGNALKYTRDRNPASIHVKAVRRPAGEGIEVTDNGVGFQMQYVAKLFGVFQRLHQAEEFEGTGIGLASMRRIVERHGGAVWAQGVVGEGATFGFTLAPQITAYPAAISLQKAQ